MKALVKGLLGLTLVTGGMAGVYFNLQYSGWIIALGGIYVIAAVAQE
jgi:hypothetical protein